MTNQEDERPGPDVPSERPAGDGDVEVSGEHAPAVEPSDALGTPKKADQGERDGAEPKSGASTKRMPVWRRLLRVLGTLLLIGYSWALMTAATPRQITPQWYMDVRNEVRQTFLDHYIHAGSFVFRGWLGKYKRKHARLAFFGVYQDGRVERLYRTQDGQWDRKIRIIDDVEDTFITKAAGMDNMSRLVLGFRGERSLKRNLGRFRNSPQLSRLNRFFCQSELIPTKGLTTVYTTAWIANVNYETGSVKDRVVLLHAYDCRRKRRLTIRGTEPQFAANDERGIHVVKMPVSPPTRTRKPRRGRIRIPTIRRNTR